MITKANVHPILRVFGFFGLFLAMLSNSSKFDNPFINSKYYPYIIILSLAAISLGLYFRIKFAEEKPSIVTYVVTSITLLVALTIAGLFLYAFFFPY